MLTWDAVLDFLTIIIENVVYLGEQRHGCLAALDQGEREIAIEVIDISPVCWLCWQNSGMDLVVKGQRTESE